MPIEPNKSDLVKQMEHNTEQVTRIVDVLKDIQKETNITNEILGKIRDKLYEK